MKNTPESQETAETSETILPLGGKVWFGEPGNWTELKVSGPITVTYQVPASDSRAGMHEICE